jgi:hypothetical protein
VRDPDPLAARVRMEAIWQLFKSTEGWTETQRTVDGATFEVVRPLGEPYSLAFDAHARVVLGCNFELRRSE